MARDVKGIEIYPGDTVKCVARYYQRVGHGQTTTVDATDGRCIESDVFSKTYGFDARFKGENFEIIHYGPHNPLSGCVQTKGTNLMIHAAIRIDGLNTTDELVHNLNGGNNAVSPHYETSCVLLRTWVEQDIKLRPEHQWLMLSPVSIAEIAGPPVRFRNVK